MSDSIYRESRWASVEEIRGSASIARNNIAEKNVRGCGIPILSDGNTVYVDNSDTHSMIFGSTGSKKTRLIGMPLINMIALAGESFIAADPKGELYQKTSGLASKNGYRIFVLNLRDLNRSDYWNPLALPYALYHSGKADEAISMLNDFLTSLAEPQRSNAKDVYWIETASSLALASMLFFIETAAPEEANIYNFVNFFTSTSNAEQIKMILGHIADGSLASVNYKGVMLIENASKTFSCVASCVSAMLNPFMIRKSLCQVLSQSSFDIRDIGMKKTAVYMIVPDEKTTLHFLITAFIKQAYETFIGEAHKLSGNKLPVRVNFVLDEFCNIPAIPDMPSMISAARSRNIRFFLFAQGIRQLQNKYGEDAHTIKGNCDNWVFLTSREYELLEEISNLCGKTSYMGFDGSMNLRPLISISELQRLKKDRGEALILHMRNYPFVTELTDIDDYKFTTHVPVAEKIAKLPPIVHYNVEKVLSEIRSMKRTIPFSHEVYGKEVMFGGMER